MNSLEQQYNLLEKYITLTRLNEKQNKYDSSTKALLKKVKKTKRELEDEDSRRVSISRGIKFLMKKYQDYGEEAAKTYKEFTGKDPKKIIDLRKRHAAFKKKQAEIMKKVKGERKILKTVHNNIATKQEKMMKLKDSVKKNKKLIAKAARIIVRKGRM